MWSLVRKIIFQILGVEGSMLRFVNPEKFSLNVSNSTFVIRVNLLHPIPSSFLFD